MTSTLCFMEEIEDKEKKIKGKQNKAAKCK